MKELWKNPQTKREKGLVCFCMFLLVILIALIAAFCFIQTKKEDSTFIPDIEGESTVCDTQVCEETARSIGEALDPSVNPCVDFYQYVCGRWIERHPVPDDKSTYSVDDVLEDELAENLSELLSGERASPTARTPKAVKDAAIIFRGCMNEEARENQGLEPLKRVLQTYEGWPMIDEDWDGSDYQWHVELAKMFRDLQRSGIITVYVSPDAKNTSRNLIHIDQAGFGLGRNQLINPNSSKRNEELVSAYREYMVSSAKILDATGDELQLNRDARDIVEFESSLAKLSRSPEEQIDVTSTYNKMTLREMQIITKNRIFLWKDFLNILFEGHAVVTDNTEVVLGELNYVTNALKLLYESKKRTIANYIGFRVVSKYGPHTTLRFRENKHNFTKIKNGVQKMPLLRMSCMGIVETLLGYAVGRLYIDQYFMEEAKCDVRNMVENVKTVYHAILKNSAWLDDATKLNILDKLEAMNNSIAYPEWIKEDEVLNAYYHTEEELKEGEYFSSLITLSKAMSQKDLEIINKPVSTVTKYFTPATVNAFYNIRGNSIEFPAGILNVPYYEYNRPLSLNFGGIGFIIGHEISHGFDNQGHQYDKDGNIADIWSEKSRQEYEEKVRCFKNQYSNYVEPLTQMQLNGNSSAGENMADNAGVKSSYFAYKLKRMLSSDNKIQNDKLPGIAASPDQLFFIGYALAWCGSERKETLESTIQYDQHSPIRYRVNIPLSNFQEFAKSFNCPIGSPMNPEEKCTLW